MTRYNFLLYPCSCRRYDRQRQSVAQRGDDVGLNGVDVADAVNGDQLAAALVRVEQRSGFLGVRGQTLGDGLGVSSERPCSCARLAMRCISTSWSASRATTLSSGVPSSSSIASQRLDLGALRG